MVYTYTTRKEVTDVYDHVISDLANRAEGNICSRMVGVNKLWDAYEAALDIAVWLRKTILEGDHGNSE